MFYLIKTQLQNISLGHDRPVYGIFVEGEQVLIGIYLPSALVQVNLSCGASCR